MTREEAMKILAKHDHSAKTADLFEALGLIKFDEPMKVTINEAICKARLNVDAVHPDGFVAFMATCGYKIVPIDEASQYVGKYVRATIGAGNAWHYEGTLISIEEIK